MKQLIPFADENVQSSVRQDFQRFIAEQRRSAALVASLGEPFVGRWDSVCAFLDKVGIETLSALSSDYESTARLTEVVSDTKARIDELLRSEPNLTKALERFSDDQAVHTALITFSLPDNKLNPAISTMGKIYSFSEGAIDVKVEAVLIGIIRTSEV